MFQKVNQLVKQGLSRTVAIHPREGIKKGQKKNNDGGQCEFDTQTATCMVTMIVMYYIPYAARKHGCHLCGEKYSCTGCC